MSISSNPSCVLTLSLPLLLAACSGGVDVVASDRATSEDTLAEDQPGGSWAVGHDLSGGSVAAAGEPDDGSEEPGVSWRLGHTVASAHLLTGSIEVSLAPGEARSLCHVVPVDVASTFLLVQHEMSDLPGSVELVATAASAAGARAVPSAFDCNNFSMPETAPFYAAQDVEGSVADGAGLASLAADSAILLRYDVANPGAGPVTATVHVALVR